ncbi:MAG: DNA alkylation repair protein, partial [Patescibacteria group bacterium]|nr:DNA alkylation repair protein [Patescibacteria group bacterium]
GLSEEVTIGLDWLWRSRNKLEAKDFKLFEKWVNLYLDNWAKIDDFSTHALGYLINRFPQLASEVFSWTKSKNRWVKRAAAVSLIYPWGKPKKYLAQIFKTALAILKDKDDLVQKGYGWMLKEAGNHNQTEVFEFVMKHKGKMPRTALRYAIEKFPSKLKQQAMS